MFLKNLTSSEATSNKKSQYIYARTHAKWNGGGNNNKSLYSRYLHHFPTFGCNSGSLNNAAKLFFVFTVFDIALALNYKPIGLTSLYNMFLKVICISN